jgi:hypothetical protein
MKIHSNDMICASASEEIGNERAGLRDPLAVTNLGLEGGGLRSRLSREAVRDRATTGAMLGIEVGRLVRPV